MGDLITGLIDLEEATIQQPGEFSIKLSIFPISTPSKVHYLGIKNKEILGSHPTNRTITDKWDKLYLKHSHK